jgi:chromosome segregation ATPase
MKTREISNTDDIINTRDVQARIDDLQSTLDMLTDAVREALEEERDLAETFKALHKDSETKKKDLADARLELHEAAKQVYSAVEELAEWLYGSPSEEERQTAREYAEDKCDFDSLDDSWELQDEAEELRLLLALKEEAGQYTSEWDFGGTLISRDYFEEYVRELVQDIGDLPKNIPNYLAIDWEETAKNIEADYSEIDFAGNPYLVRDS